MGQGWHAPLAPIGNLLGRKDLTPPICTVAPRAVVPLGPVPHLLLRTGGALAAYSPAPPTRGLQRESGPCTSWVCLWKLGAAGGDGRAPPNLPPATHGWAPQRALC